jgi:chromosome segregation ATPase
MDRNDKAAELRAGGWMEVGQNVDRWTHGMYKGEHFPIDVAYSIERSRSDKSSEELAVVDKPQMLGQIHKYKAEIERLKERLKEELDKVNNPKWLGQIHEYQAEAERLNKEIAARDNEIQTLQGEIAIMQRTVDKLLKANADLPLNTDLHPSLNSVVDLEVRVSAIELKLHNLKDWLLKELGDA